MRLRAQGPGERPADRRGGRARPRRRCLSRRRRGTADAIRPVRQVGLGGQRQVRVVHHARLAAGADHEQLAGTRGRGRGENGQRAGKS